MFNNHIVGMGVCHVGGYSWPGARAGGGSDQTCCDGGAAVHDFVFAPAAVWHECNVMNVGVCCFVAGSRKAQPAARSSLPIIL